MNFSIFLAQLFGLYFVLMGVIFLMRRKSLVPAIVEFGGSKALLAAFAAIELVAGLAVIISYSSWDWGYSLVITIIGWWMLIEGVLYLVLPKKSIRRMIKAFSGKGWYVSGSLVSIILGLYLAGVGFGIL